MEAKHERQKIKVSFEYIGTQKDWDNFILTIIADYVEKNRLFKGERPVFGSVIPNEELFVI